MKRTEVTFITTLMLVLLTIFVSCQAPLSTGLIDGEPKLDNFGSRTNITVHFVNKTGKTIREVRYIGSGGPGTPEVVVVLSPAAADNNQFSLTLPADTYSFVFFEYVNNPVSPLCLLEGVTPTNGETFELNASSGGPPPMVNITFNNISGSTINALYWRYYGDSYAPYTRIPISPASVNNSSFNLDFPNGLYELRFCYESGGNVQLIVELSPVPLSPSSYNIHIVNSTP